MKWQMRLLVLSVGVLCGLGSLSAQDMFRATLSGSGGGASIRDRDIVRSVAASSGTTDNTWSRNYLLVYNASLDRLQVIRVNGDPVADIMTFGGGSSTLSGGAVQRLSFVFLPGQSTPIGTVLITERRSANSDRASISGRMQFALPPGSSLGSLAANAVQSGNSADLTRFFSLESAQDTFDGGARIYTANFSASRRFTAGQLNAVGSASSAAQASVPAVITGGTANQPGSSAGTVGGLFAPSIGTAAIPNSTTPTLFSTSGRAWDLFGSANNNVVVTAAQLPVTTTQNTSFTSQDLTFLQDAVQLSAGEVQLGQLFQERSRNLDVTSHGRRLVLDHTTAIARLNTIAQNSGLTLVQDPGPVQRAWVNDLTAVNDQNFDIQAKQLALQAAQVAIQIFQQETISGGNADLQAFAQQELGVFQDELRQAAALGVGL